MKPERITLVTGGMGGLGEAIATRLHDDGLRVVVTHSIANDRVANWLAVHREGGRVFAAVAVDVGDFASCEACAARVTGEFGPDSVLINNAGITRDAQLRKMRQEDWAAVIRTNLDSVFNMTRPLCEAMASMGWGRIVNISSVNGSSGAFGQANYAAAKAGMHGFTKALAIEMATRGVTVNTVSPGYLDTSMVRAIPAEILEKKILPQIPIGRLGQPSEVAALISYLCSDVAGFESRRAGGGREHVRRKLCAGCKSLAGRYGGCHRASAASPRAAPQSGFRSGQGHRCHTRQRDIP